MTSEKGSRKDKNQNIQVFVRLRPLNQRERDIKSLGVIEVVNNREVVVRQSQQTTHTKKFTFDRAFGPNVKQVEVYQDVVSPLIEEVLAGYNCTVFAYGQTGTGKTHTMVGEHTGDETTWQSDPLAGIIPRALSQLFDELRISNTEYTVRVSYLELYNEELFDLLSSSEDNSKLRIYEDVTRKGSNIVNGLEEITVYNKNEVYKIMSQGQERKRVASTLMNAQSSRSHTVFTIVVHMKENSPEGEELVKIGKLNLVDLAGSENISKAGSDNPAKRERARECVNINQSLLTLGRVITALVERHPHIPYRESKLTRILQESLGGRTKTSIIATISPGHKDLEETMSTLEYANRAKNIQNKPELNQKMTKRAILKEYAEEIDRLKRDLQASRDKNGVYLANETYTEMTLKDEEQRKEIQELLLRKRAMEDEKEKMEGIFQDLTKKLEDTDSQLNCAKDKLQNTKAKLSNTVNMLKTTKQQYEETRHLVEKQQETEQKLSAVAAQILSVADLATTHVDKLHDSVDRRKNVEITNLDVTRTFREHSAQLRSYITVLVDELVCTLGGRYQRAHGEIDNYNAQNTQTCEQTKHKLDGLMHNLAGIMNEIKSLTSKTQENLTTATTRSRQELYTSLQEHNHALAMIMDRLVVAVENGAKTAAEVNVVGCVQGFVNQWHEGASHRVRSLQQIYNKHSARIATQQADALTAYRGKREERKSRKHSQRIVLDTRVAEIEEEKAKIEQRLAKQLSSIQQERREVEDRLTLWREEEIKRIEEHVTKEKIYLEERLQKKILEVEEERKLFEQRISKLMEWQEAHLVSNSEDNELDEEDLRSWETHVSDATKLTDGFNREFDAGASAITSDMEALCVNVVEVLDHVDTRQRAAISRAAQDIRMEAESAKSQDSESCTQLVQNTDLMMKSILAQHQDHTRTVIHNLQTISDATLSQLDSISQSTSLLISSSTDHTSSLHAMLRDLEGVGGKFVEEVRDRVETQAQTEDCLMSEYCVYNPSGATPMRSEYRFPRALPATSPHQRVLARYRANRVHNNEDDCIVVESDVERASDSESSVSEDSAMFPAPSPPQYVTPHAHGIVKCISESDIYRKNQPENGKENVNRSVSYKKPSKLPAPASHKKPLVERN